jgi:hypothetical protein
MNEKGSMTDEEFEKYIDNSILPLYPDLKDTPGKRFLLKAESGPGRNGRELLVRCRCHGLYIYPGLPNATSVQQETDLNYGLFKSVVRQPQRNIVGFLPCRSIDTPQHVNIWAHCLWRYHPGGHHVNHHLPKRPYKNFRCGIK